MRMSGTSIELSASDLSQFLGCRHLTALNLAVAQGLRAAPTWVDPVLMVLRQRGLDHERSYIDTLASEGLSVSNLSDCSDDEAILRSADAMAAGLDAIVQPALRNGRWFGRPDVLRRVEMPSAIGPWSYQVADTKLARETRGGTVLQLLLYSELLSIAQGLVPENFHVVTPDPANPIQTFRVQDYTAYFRLIRGRLEATSLQNADVLAAANYPEPVEQCDVCRWRGVCDKRRHDDDHLSLVAGISRLQSRELEAAGVRTLTQLATLPLPLPFVPGVELRKRMCASEIRRGSSSRAASRDCPSMSCSQSNRTEDWRAYRHRRPATSFSIWRETRSRGTVDASFCSVS